MKVIEISSSPFKKYAILELNYTVERGKWDLHFKDIFREGKKGAQEQLEKEDKLEEEEGEEKWWIEMKSSAVTCGV